MTFRVLFAVVAYFDLDNNPINEKIAFLYGFINQLVYIDISKGFESETT